MQLRAPAVILGICVSGCGVASREPAAHLELGGKPSVAIVREHVHDFGVVPPGAVLNHEFVVRNDESRRRRLAGISQGCSCVAARPKSSILEPHGELQIPVTYRVGAELRDERRRISLYFQGEPQPVELVVQARIRKPLTVTPRRLEAGAEWSALPGFLVENFSHEDWRNVAVSGPEWMAFHAHLVSNDRGGSAVSPRQLWRVQPQRRHNVELPQGRGLVTITVAAESRPEFTDALLFGWDLRPAMQAAPETLYFGHVPIGSVRGRNIDIRLSRQAVASIPEIVSVEPERSDLRIALVPGRTGSWQLRAELTAQVSGPFETRVTLRAAGADDLTIPIRGVVFAGGEAPP